MQSMTAYQFTKKIPFGISKTRTHVNRARTIRRAATSFLFCNAHLTIKLRFMLALPTVWSLIYKIFNSMCLYPRIIKNKKYSMYNVNKNKTKPIDDYRKLYVAIGCGHCIECMKQKAREWQVRLNEELKMWNYKYFVTLTFSREALQKLCEEEPALKENVNNLAKKAVRRFLERWRKKNKESTKHWLITELGHQGTERIHLHGILFTKFPINNKYLTDIWQYGNTYVGDYCNEQTINYIVKYVTKIDIDHKGYMPDIFCSAGLGKNYVEDEFNKRKHAFNGKDTIQYYTLKNGLKIALPQYYRNKFWTQKERNELWTIILDSNKTWVKGVEIKNINTQEGYHEYIMQIEEQQRVNKQMGYGSTENEWNEKAYKVTFDMLNKRSGKKS